jgi:hypothetical protein
MRKSERLRLFVTWLDKTRVKKEERRDQGVMTCEMEVVCQAGFWEWEKKN